MKTTWAFICGSDLHNNDLVTSREECNLNPAGWSIIRKRILGEPLAIIFNTSIESGIFPTKLKIAKVIPIFKAGDATAPSNYRPISLLSIFNKIFEKLIYKRLNSYLISKEIISESQYGFREKHSTEHAILDNS